MQNRIFKHSNNPKNAQYRKVTDNFIYLIAEIFRLWKKMELMFL